MPGGGWAERGPVSTTCRQYIDNMHKIWGLCRARSSTPFAVKTTLTLRLCEPPHQFRLLLVSQPPRGVPTFSAC